MITPLTEQQPQRTHDVRPACMNCQSNADDAVKMQHYSMRFRLMTCKCGYQVLVDLKGIEE